MSKYQELKDIMLADPATFSVLTNAQAAAEFNLMDKTRVLDSMTGSSLFALTDEGEYAALADNKKQEWLALCGIELVLKAAVPIIKGIFPNGTTTWSAIVSAATVASSTAEEHGLGRVREGDIANARAI